MLDEATLSLTIALLMVAAVVASYVFAWYSWRRATHPISDRFALLMAADGSWALFALLGHVSPTDGLALVWRRPFLVAVVFSGLLWFLFVVEYTADSEWIPDAVEWALLGLGTLFALLFVVNPGGLAYTDPAVARYGVLRVPYETFGPLLRLQILFNYLLVLAAFALLGRFMLRSRNLFRKQAAVIFAAAAAAVTATVAFFLGLTPHPRLDLTPIFFTLQAIGVGVALYRYDFLDVEPMAAHTLLAELDDPVFVAKTDGRLADWNRAADSYVDADADQPSLTDVRDLDLAARLRRTDGGTVVADQPLGADGARVTVTGRHVQTFDVRTTPIEDRYGVVRGHAIVLRDITEKEQRKQALEAQNKRLEEFTGVVSHDLRNPLQVIDGHVELARQTGELDHLASASDAVDRMEQMLDDLLRLASEGQTIDETDPVELEACCRAAWDTLAADGATLAVDTDRTVEADATRLQRVFENLFRNAVEHGTTSPDPQARRDTDENGETRRPSESEVTTDDSAAVAITVGDTDDGFYVADDGPGIPPEERDAIFDFGTTFAEDGTGFGLAIVQQIVAAHGWSITVTESDTGGARFDVSLADVPTAEA